MRVADLIALERSDDPQVRRLVDEYGALWDLAQDVTFAVSHRDTEGIAAAVQALEHEFARQDED